MNVLYITYMIVQPLSILASPNALSVLDSNALLSSYFDLVVDTSSFALHLL